MSELNEIDITNKLFELQVKFKQLLPEKLANISGLWKAVCLENHQDIIKLHHQLHELAGTAGTHGAISITQQCKSLINIIKLPMQNVDSFLEFSQLDIDKFNRGITCLKKSCEQWQPSKVPYIEFLKEELKTNNRLIYFAEDDNEYATILKVELEKDGHDIRHFSNLKDFESACYNKLPAIVIMDMLFDSPNQTGAHTISSLKDHFSNFPPVIFLSAYNDIYSRLAAVRAGADRYLTKPTDFNKLRKTIDNMITVEDSEPYRVLIIDDSESILVYYEAILKSAGIEVKTLSNPLDCLAMLSEFKPELVVVDIFMPECSGFELAQIIRQDDIWSLIPIIFLTSEFDEETQNNALASGADEFIIKPAEPDYFITSVISKVKRARAISELHRDFKNTLRESRYQLATMNQHDVVIVTDIDGMIKNVNDKFCQISGYARNELIGKECEVLKSERYDELFYRSIIETVSKGEIWQGSLCGYSKKGVEYWIETSVVPFLDEQGKPYQYVTAGTNITDLRKNQERLNKSQLFANIGSWDWDISNEEFFWSDRIWGLLGYESSVTPSYKNFIKSVHPEDKQKVRNAIKCCVNGEGDYNIEHRVVWPDGSIRWLHQSGNSTRNRLNQITNMLGVVRDITARKTAEDNQKKTEMRFSIAVDGSGDGVWDWDLVNHKIQFTRHYFAMLGYQQSEPPQTVEFWMENIHPDDVSDFQDNLNTVISGPDSQFSTELRLRCKSGDYKWILSRGAVVDRNTQGKAERIIGVNSDISKRKQEEQELISAREAAESGNKTKSEFLSSMSHELRTPMNAIIGFAQLMKSDPENPLNECQQDSVGEILKAGKHLLELINEVLDLARIESGRINLSIEAVVVSEVIIESLQLVSPLAQNKNINIDFCWNQTPIKQAQLLEQTEAVKADRTRLKQGLLNLLSNAIKYTQQGGRVSIHFRQFDDGYSRIYVIDNGPGLSTAQQADLFKPFNRLGIENEEEVEGTGIGLVITKKIIELMQGKIGLKTQEGSGCQFWIELPVEVIPRLQEKIIDKVNQVDDSSIRTKYKHTVLYIEDNPANLRLVTQLLNRLPGLHLWSAPEPFLGLELASEHRPDLILLDINLPGMSGFEVLKHLRQRNATKDIPVIAISANAMPKDIEKGIEAGFDDYVTKPIDIKTLLQSVKQRLENIRK